MHVTHNVLVFKFIWIGQGEALQRSFRF